MKYGMKLPKLFTSKNCCCPENCRIQKTERSSNGSICPCCGGKRCGLLSASANENNYSNVAKSYNSFSFLSVYK
ncbi:hypothetical protein HNY73_017021 [Argiope bruennichi]|uniref:Uncharacterized protein n=1 Tax=Argiope bruennichi TaxID=94029 RepID=A0A8T0EM22_ARGBR|nr:hypothetical protein HNY73_017021 [Argiope bruennichi]